jgi:hypothetical protein
LIHAHHIELRLRADDGGPAEDWAIDIMDDWAMWAAADRRLVSWAAQVQGRTPAVVDAAVYFPDGQRWRHIYTLYPLQVEAPNLARGMRDMLYALSGANRMVLTPRWLHARGLGIDVATMERYAQVMKTHAFGDPPPLQPSPPTASAAQRVQARIANRRAHH